MIDSASETTILAYPAHGRSMWRGDDGLAGHRVELMSSDPMCLGRFSRFVTRVHASPASGRGFPPTAVQRLRAWQHSA